MCLACGARLAATMSGSDSAIELVLQSRPGSRAIRTEAHAACATLFSRRRNYLQSTQRNQARAVARRIYYCEVV